jgi:hypothetical protein
VSLHEPTIPDLLQAIDELKEREAEQLRELIGLRSAAELADVQINAYKERVTRLETELATLRARGS